MHWFDILVIIFLILILMGGVKDGAVKTFFSTLALIIAVPLTGISYHLIAGLLSFLPGVNWENFFGFFITMGIIIAVFSIIFMLPRKFVRKIWRKGCLFRLFGGLLNLFNAGVGLTVFTLVLLAYPIFDWLARLVSSSGILMWLANTWGFVANMLPEALRHAPQMVTIITGG